MSNVVSSVIFYRYLYCRCYLLIYKLYRSLNYNSKELINGFNLHTYFSKMNKLLVCMMCFFMNICSLRQVIWIMFSLLRTNTQEWWNRVTVGQPFFGFFWNLVLVLIFHIKYKFKSYAPFGDTKKIKINLLYKWTFRSQTKHMVIISIDASTTIVKFMAPGSEVLV